MGGRRCFVQFPHPGGEHEPERDGKIGWNKRHLPHKRKFMQFRGEWTDENRDKHCCDLRAWGEWEPESELICELDPPKGSQHHPCYLWKPYWVPKNTYRGLHNTDPFIFGDCFLYSNYSNCRQSANPGVRHLAPGSVIAFGSGKKIDGERKWVLDTVFVVRDSCLYDPRDTRGTLGDKVPDTFLEVTGGPLSDNDEEASCSGTCASTPERLRLYWGATPDNPVHGMFSFFPAVPADRESSFARPVVEPSDKLSAEYFNPGSWQAPKGLTQDRALSLCELRGLWDSLVAQVREKDLVLGTHAEMPEHKFVRAAATRGGGCSHPTTDDAGSTNRAGASSIVVNARVWRYYIDLAKLVLRAA